MNRNLTKTLASIYMLEDLSWSSQSDYLCTRAYKTLVLLQCTLEFFSTSQRKQTTLYCNGDTSIVVLLSHLKGCRNSPKKKPKECHKVYSCVLLIKLALKLFFLMYYSELYDLFFISNLKKKTLMNFSTLSYVSFSTAST